jgi:putative SOS response-associated peptidase YedK
MCGRYTLVDPGAIAARYGTANVLEELHPRYNAAPGQGLPVIVREEGKARAEVMRWGLVPSWAKDPGIGYRMINARAETAAEKPSFRSAFRRRRCLVPTTGFYEWKKEGEAKQPYFIHLKEVDLFSFVGLYERWRDAAGNELATFTILTTEPNVLLRSIHDRMPVILRREDEGMWIDTENKDADGFAGLLRPYDPDAMEVYQVSGAVNSPGNEARSLIEPEIR